MKNILNKKNTYFKKTIVLLVLSSTFALQVLAAESDAEELKAKESKIERMTVTATRSSLSIDDALTSQVVITREQIDLINPTSIIELLSTLPGIDIARNGGKGQIASIFMRGSNSGHTLVLVDGIRISSAILGSSSFNTISPEMIGRIEVVQGPRAALWGADAIGGVIQIFTRKLEGGEHYAGVTLGSEKYREYKAGIGFSHGDGQTTVNISHEKAEGYDVKENIEPWDVEPDNDGYKFTSVVVRGQQALNQKLSLDWMLSNDQGENEYDGFFNSSDINRHALLVRANYTTVIDDVKNHTTFSLGQNRDSSETLRDGVFQSVFETRRDQLSFVNNSQFSDEFQANVGIDFYQDDVFKNDAPYDVESRDITGAFAHALYGIDLWSFEGTVRHDNVSGIDSAVTYNLGAGININDDTRIVLNHGTGFKVPSFDQLYFPLFGTDTLNSEHSETTELFMETRFSNIETRVNFYYSIIDELIAPNNDGQAENFKEVEIKGAELIVKVELLSGTHDFNFSYTDAEDMSTSEQLARRAKEKFNYKFTTSIDVADLYAEYQFVGSREDAVFEQENVQLDAYQLLNIGLNAPITESLFLNARATNVLDKEYQTANTFISRGRTLNIGITYKNF